MYFFMYPCIYVPGFFQDFKAWWYMKVKWSPLLGWWVEKLGVTPKDMGGAAPPNIVYKKKSLYVSMCLCIYVFICLCLCMCK